MHKYMKQEQDYPNKLSSIVALYCDGTSISAERANSVSFRDCCAFFDIISVKLTNWGTQRTSELR